MTSAGTGLDSAGGTSEGAHGRAGAVDPTVDRAIRLFEFLKQAQRLKTRPVASLETYRRSGDVVWWHELPIHPAVSVAPDDSTDAGSVLRVERVEYRIPPTAPEGLAEFVEGPFDDPSTRPRLRSERAAEDQAETTYAEASEECPPGVASEFAGWLELWEEWAAQEQRDGAARDFYKRLFSIYLTISGHPEQKELLLGRACLSWRIEGQGVVQRHLLTTSMTIVLDETSGALSLQQASDSVAVELDMLDPSLIAHPQSLPAVREKARAMSAGNPDRNTVSELARRVVYALSSEAEYHDTDEPGVAGPNPVVAYAPALILRDRSQQGLVDIFSAIVDQMSGDQQVPEGLRPLVDPDHQPAPHGGAGDAANSAGAVVMVDDEPFLPMPVNETQLRIIRQVDTHAQTLVQGPPGTGKTHTAAALISHLLAQGLRVLVTAHTDRALREIRGKLPMSIRPLAVSVMGTAGEDMAELRVAVERLAAQAGEAECTDPAAVDAAIQERMSAIDGLRRERARASRDLLALREREVHHYEIAGYQGTLAAIAQQLDAERDDFQWLADCVEDATGQPPLSDADIVNWHQLSVDPGLTEDELEAARRFPDPASLPDPDRLASMVDAEAQAASAGQRFAALHQHPVFESLRRLPSAERVGLRSRMAWLVNEAAGLQGRRNSWVREALADVRERRGGPWQARLQQLDDLIVVAQPLVAALGAVRDVRVIGGDVDALVPLAQALQAHLDSGGRVKVGPAGDPRPGAFAPRPVKQAALLFERARVDGLPPARPDQLEVFLAWVQATRTLLALDRAWPAGTDIPPEDTLHEQLQWHQDERDVLRRLLGLDRAYGLEERHQLERGLPRPDWRDPNLPSTYLHLVDAAAAADAHDEATRALEQVESRFSTSSPCEGGDALDQAACAVTGLEAIRLRDRTAYSSAYRRLQRLEEVRRQVARRDALDRRLQEGAHGLHLAVVASLDDPAWTARLAEFNQAWRWTVARGWLTNAERQDVNTLQARVTRLEADIRVEVERLSATRAWSHAVHPDRLSRGARASLEQYVYLVRRLGKGTGTHQAQRRAEVREAMDRCRASVPVWILPLYRIADQLTVSRDMFDVVIVDEASQAGLEATFLQYLAPKIVVVGDDKQVSPLAVGVDQQQLRTLADQYLYDDPYRATWQDPQRSLFDEAKMRFSGMLTLTEHRRCVPEIIGFSNRIAYEPNGIRLVSVRQYGADRLDPVKTVHLCEGYSRGTTSKINPVEVDAIVDQIEACLADPRYDGLTFGVISLLGSAQARAIERKLLDRIPGETWAARELRVGDSADFQGSERNVMFLSMVVAPEPGRRIVALTRETYVQRYNVAASRAKDQLWVFHSVSLNDLTNTEDMRFQLLDYCHGVQTRGNDPVDGAPTACVSNDERVAPFDSLFEQRVFNRLLDRGYTVVPQFPALGYRIDLVVVGGTYRLAIECDGDAWHGPDAYQRDMARQRELERCGWQFFRIRESEFYVDPAAALDDLWMTLDDMRGTSKPPQAELDIPIEPLVPVGGGAELDAEWEVLDQAEAIYVEPGDYDDPLLPESETFDGDERNTAVGGSADVAVDDDGRSSDRAAPSEEGLAPYQAFLGETVPTSSATRSELIDGLVRILAVEGPVLTDRAFTLYVRAAGGRKVGRQIAQALTEAVTAATRRGQIVRDNPLKNSDAGQRTLRLPNQPTVVCRAIGPRTFDEVPPLELAELLSRVRSEGFVDEQQLHREALRRYGLKRLTPNVVGRLRAAAALIER